MRKLIFLTGIILGAVLMYFSADFWYSPGSYAFKQGIGRSIAPINGLHVFVNSNPYCDDCYQQKDEFTGEGIYELISNLGLNEEQAATILPKFFANGKQSNYRNNLEALTQCVKEKYPDADAIIINKEMSSCIVIKYN